MSRSIAKQNAPKDKRSIEEDARNRLTEGSDYGFYLREIRCHLVFFIGACGFGLAETHTEQ